MAALSVAEALAKILDSAAPLPSQAALLADAVGRVLAGDVAALRTQPPGDVSAMDGYAVRGADVAQALVTLDVIGEVAAGHPFDGSVGAGQAARIFTGGLLPDGADTVVIQENTRRDGDRVVIETASAPARHVRRKGLDFAEGDVLLRAGQIITSRDLMLAASMNHAALPVHRAPRVAIFATGDELVLPGSTVGPGQIVYSNGYALTAMARREGAEVINLGIVPDSLEATVAAIRKARDSQADVLVTTGGASVGDHDLVQRSLAAEGLELSFWRIALRPGRPMIHGHLGGMHVLGLPGNPVSSFTCALLFMVPLIRSLSGHTGETPGMTEAVLGADVAANDERADYMRAILSKDDQGRIVATPVRLQDSSMMQALARAGGFVIRQPHAPAARTGDSCRVLLFGL